MDVFLAEPEATVLTFRTRPTCWACDPGASLRESYSTNPQLRKMAILTSSATGPSVETVGLGVVGGALLFGGAAAVDDATDGCTST
jgi:hypothetical protein